MIRGCFLSARFARCAVPFFDSSLSSPVSSVRFAHGKRKRDSLSKKTQFEEINWSEPLTKEEEALLPDIRKMTNKQWMESCRHQDQQIWACYHHIYPDVLSSPHLPDINLLVEYPNDELVYRGNWMEPASLFEKPKVYFEPEGTENVDRWDTYWTLLMLDVDEPCHEQPDGRSKQLWTVVNIPARGKIEDGATLVEYQPPTPWKHTGPHRYIFLLFRQCDGLRLVENEEPISALDWTTKRNGLLLPDFISKHQLHLHSYVFFQSKWNETVSEYFAKLGVEEPMWETDEEAIERNYEERIELRRQQRQLERRLGMRIK